MVKDELYETVNARHSWSHNTVLEAALGLASEAGEVAQLVRKGRFESIPIRPGVMLMELSDVLHYLMLACACYGVTLEQVGDINAAKMKARDDGNGQWFEALMYQFDIDKDFGEQMDEVKAHLEALR